MAVVKNNSGYVPYYRKITKETWYKNISAHIVFDHCLVSANWEPGTLDDGTPIEIGSFITSYNKLADETGLSVGQVRSGLTTLKTAHVITQETTHRYSKITLINWAKYNSIGKSATKQITQNTTRDTTTIKEDRETKEEKDRLKDRLINSSDVKELCEILGFNTLSNRQCLVIQNEWFEYKTLNQIVDIVERAKEHNPKNLFSYVHTIIMKSIPKEESQKIELIDYPWWEED